MSTLHGYRYAVVDVEGNGQTPPDIIEIAIVPLDDGVIDDGHTWLVRPPKPINPIVTRKVHGIRDSDVADAPTWAEIEPEVLAALRGRTIVAHNARVEYDVLARHMPSWQPDLVLDTLRLAKSTWPGQKGSGGYGLDALIAHAGIAMEDTPGKRHRAGFDAHATALLFAHLAGLQQSNRNILETAAVPGIGGANDTTPSTQESLW